MITILLRLVAVLKSLVGVMKLLVAVLMSLVSVMNLYWQIGIEEATLLGPEITSQF